MDHHEKIIEENAEEIETLNIKIEHEVCEIHIHIIYENPIIFKKYEMSTLYTF